MDNNGKSLKLRGLIIFAVIMLIMWFFMSRVNSTPAMTYRDFKAAVTAGQVTSVTISQNEQTPTGVATVRKNDGTAAEMNLSDVAAFENELRSSNIEYELGGIKTKGIFLETILPIVISGVIMIFLFSLMMGKMNGSNAQMANFGKSRARMTRDNKISFKDVAGLEEEKEDLADVVDFLKNPEKYTELGARIPKGIILEGPPGTGKTLIAKAVAGEAKVPFFSISGSDFVEMFVGVGASRVRDLFKEAKKMTPCIVFIDEIDAVGRRRGSGLGGSHDEREQTLNQLLVEMDGFGVNEGVIVLAATNRVDILDPAILRPGRFDRKVVVGRPDVKGREEILKVHARRKPIADDVDFRKIAQTTSGFTGADLENLLNEAAILAAKAGQKLVTNENVTAAFIKVGIGTEKKSRVMTEKDRRITAYHESGHAILFHDLPDMDPVHTVSIIPTGLGAAGYTMPLPSNDDTFNTKGKMLQHIMVLLGGRIAEEIVFDDITSGASQDIKQATGIAKTMVMQYGMSDKLGMVNYGSEGDEIFIGRDLGQQKSYSEHMAQLIDEEVKSIIDECHMKAKEIIVSRRDILDKASALLMEREKITGEEFDALYV